MGTTYKDAGVDIDAGDALVERIKPLASATSRPEVIAGVGGFGGLFALPPGKYQEPVLVCGTDGVGTKLKIAFGAGRHQTVGIDLVAMSVNDVITSGAEPLFFLDYFATSRLDLSQASQVIAGIADGCREAGCALIGGETAELPGFYASGEYDLAGFCVGVVERSRILDGRSIEPGDAVVGISSTGLHSNGFSLARKILFTDHRLSWSIAPHGFHRPLEDELLSPTRIYAKAVAELSAEVRLKGLAHITGGGIPGNLPRILPEGTQAFLEERSWQRSAIFDFIAKLGNVPSGEMFATFNMGLGMIAVLAPAEVPAALRTLSRLQIPSWEVGRIEKGSGEPKATVLP